MTFSPEHSPRISARTETHLAALHPGLEPIARRFLQAAQGKLPAGVTIEIVSSLRTYAEQTALYAKGRTAPGKIVTNAKAGESWHNFDEQHGAVAFDIGLFRGSDYLEDSPLYETLGPVGVTAGLEWGGNWKSIHDAPHYQLPLEKYGVTLAMARLRHKAGADVAAGTPFEIPPPAIVLPSGGWSVVVDGKQIATGLPPNEKGTGLVRLVAQSLGASVGADPVKKIVTLVPASSPD